MEMVPISSITIVLPRIDDEKSLKKGQQMESFFLNIHSSLFFKDMESQNPFFQFIFHSISSAFSLSSLYLFTFGLNLWPTIKFLMMVLCFMVFVAAENVFLSLCYVMFYDIHFNTCYFEYFKFFF